MSFRIVVTGKTDADKAEHVFDQDTVSIGRSKACDLTLEDPKQIVGRSHAKIEKRGSSYYVVDLGSRNATFLNKTKIESRSARLLRHGDRLNIGRFSLEFFTVETALIPENYERTLYDGLSGNPFEDHIGKFRSVFEEVRAAYDSAPSDSRDDALNAMMGTLVREMQDHPVGEHFLTRFQAGIAEQLPADEESRNQDERERSLHLLGLMLPWAVRILKRQQKFQSEFFEQTARGFPGFPRSLSGTATEPEKHLRVLHLSEKEWRAFESGIEDLLADFEKHQQASYEALKASAEK